VRQKQHASLPKKSACRHFGIRGKLLFFLISAVILNSSIQNLYAADVTKAQSTTITIETTGQPVYKSHFFDNPPRIVLNFAPQVLFSKLNQDISVNRGTIRNIHCNYYASSTWLRSLTFLLTAKTGYNIAEDGNNISISILSASDQSVNATLKDELVIKDYMPKSWGSVQRREALKAAIKFVRIKRQMFRSLTNTVDSSVIVQRKTDNSVRITATNLTPVQMIATGTKVLFSEPISTEKRNTSVVMPAQAYIQTLPAVKSSGFGTSGADLAKVSLGLGFILLGALVVNYTKARDTIKTLSVEPVEVEKELPKNEKKLMEELFLKEEELQKWPKYSHTETKTTTVGEAQPEQLSKEIFNFTSLPSDIAERRRFPRADIKNSRGILNRALVGSKTQPFKNIRVNDISKGGLSFQVKSKEIKFRAPTIVKLYFSNSTKPVDLWVRVMWEKEDVHGEGKSVGAKFTRVPKDTWDKIMESFGHRLG